MNVERDSKDFLIDEQRSSFSFAMSSVAAQILQEDSYLGSFVSQLNEKQREAFVSVSIDLAGVRKFGRRNDEEVKILRGGKSTDKLQDKWDRTLQQAALDPSEFMGTVTTFAETLELAYENDPSIIK